MRMHSPSMPELHAFLHVARLGSCTAAAQVLCVTQGAVSRAIQRLEQRLRTPLFTRQGQRLHLTDFGHQYLARIQAPLLRIEAASNEAAIQRPVHELTLSVVPTWASVWLIPRLPDFHARHPDTRLRFVPYRKDEDFSAPLPDAAVLTGRGPSQWPDWWCDYVVGHDVVPVCAPRRLTARRDAGRWQAPGELAAEPLLYHASAVDNWAQWFQAAGCPQANPNLANCFDQVSILVQAAIVDMGVAVVQRCLIQRELAEGTLSIPFDLPITVARGYFLCMPAQRQPTPAFWRFRDWLLAQASDGYQPTLDAVTRPATTEQPSPAA